MRKKIIILILLPFLLCGCYNYHELEDLGIVSSIYFDYNDTYKVVCEITADDKTYYYEAIGTSITDAINNLNYKSPYYLYYMHLNIIILSKTIDISEVIEYLTRNAKVNSTFYVVTSNNYQEDLEDDIGLIIKKTIINSNNDNYDFFKLSKAYYEKKEHLIIPNYDKKEINSFSIYKNNKYKYELSLDEMNLYNILKGKNNSNIKVNFKNGFISINTDKINCKTINKKMIIEIDATIKELTSNVDTTKIDIINDLESTVNNYLENKLDSFINSNDLFDISEIKINTHINKKGLIIK